MPHAGCIAGIVSPRLTATPAAPIGRALCMFRKHDHRSVRRAAHWAGDGRSTPVRSNPSVPMPCGPAAIALHMATRPAHAHPSAVSGGEQARRGTLVSGRGCRMAVKRVLSQEVGTAAFVLPIRVRVRRPRKLSMGSQSISPVARTSFRMSHRNNANPIAVVTNDLKWVAVEIACAMPRMNQREPCRIGNYLVNRFLDRNRKPSGGRRASLGVPVCGIFELLSRSWVEINLHDRSHAFGTDVDARPTTVPALRHPSRSLPIDAQFQPTTPRT